MLYTLSTNPALDLTLTVPQIHLGPVLRAVEVRREWGGKGFNVSRTLHGLGAQNVAMAFAAGHTGRALEEGLQEAGILTDFVYVPGETRTNVVITEPDGRHIKVNQPGAAVSESDCAAFLQRIASLAQPGDYWIITGSLPPGAGAGFYADLIRLVRNAGGHTLLDSSGSALLAGLEACPDLVKPNQVEAEQVVGYPVTTDAEAAAAAGEIASRYGVEVALSLGKEGVLLANSTGKRHVRPPAVKVRTAVGAGDALVAGLVWALSRGLDLWSAGHWGVAVATTHAIDDQLPAEPWPVVEDIFRRCEWVSG